MDLKEVDPFEVTVSGFNERTENVQTSGMEKSVEQHGIVQPPIVRELDESTVHGALYEVVVGQRRTMAAQATKGIESIPVVVMGWDDAEALEASITENIDAFQREVTTDDRAAAVLRLMELRDYTKSEVANRLGVDNATITNWLEATREEWVGTEIEPEFQREDDDLSGANEGDEPDANRKDVREVGGTTLRTIRNATGGGEEGEELAQQVAEGDLNRDDVREISAAVDQGDDVDQATKRVLQQKSGEERMQVSLSISGDLADDLVECARNRGTTNKDVARTAIETYLNEETRR